MITLEYTKSGYSRNLGMRVVNVLSMANHLCHENEVKSLGPLIVQAVHKKVAQTPKLNEAARSKAGFRWNSPSDQRYSFSP